MSHQISANELKTRGVSALRDATNDGSEAIITVRGKNRYVVMPIESYNRLRECELEAALLEVREEVKKGKYHKGSVKNHMKRITRG